MQELMTVFPDKIFNVPTLKKQHQFFGKYAIIFSVKTMNKQIMGVINFVLTVIGAFTFGYKATEYSLTEPIVPLVSAKDRRQNISV